MLNKKSIIAAFIGVMILFGSFRVSASEINDLDQCAEYAKPAVVYLINKGVLTGYNGRINPADKLTRSQMVIMIVKSLKVDIGNAPAVPSFKDVPAEHFSYAYVEAALKVGIISMSASKTFLPNEEITREQMATMLVRSLGVTQEELFLNQRLDDTRALIDRNKLSGWAHDYVEFCLDYGLMSGVGDSRFAPQDKAERQQAAAVIYRFILAGDKLRIITAGFKRGNQIPELFQAMKKSVTYNQAVINTGLSHRVERMYPTISGGYEQFSRDTLYSYYSHVSGNIFNNNSDLDIQTYIQDGKEQIVQDYKMITHSGQKYYKNNILSKGHEYAEQWKAVRAGEIKEAGFTSSDWQTQSVSYMALLRNYNNQTFAMSSGTDEYGQPVKIYTLKFNRHNADEFGLDLILDKVLSGNETLKEAFDLWLDIEVSFALFSNNDLYRMGAKFDGMKSVPGKTKTADIIWYQTGISFNKIGAYLPIVPPIAVK